MIETTPAGSHAWTFLSNHAHALICLAGDEDCRVRDLAERIGITERATQRIVADLVQGGYLQRIRVGRRNHYEVHAELHFRHPIEERSTIGSLLTVLTAP